MTDQNSTGNTKHRPESLIKKYGIKSSAYYQRIKFLNIKAQKDEDKKAYLTDEQVEMMDALHEYINNNGKMEGFTFSVGGNEAASELVVSNTNDVDENAGKMTIAEGAKLSQQEPESIIEQEVPKVEPDFSDGMEQLFREAAETKAQNLAMPGLVKMHLVNQMTFDDLPKDLQNQVTKIHEAASPKLNPASIASKALEKRRAAKLGGK
ncbi:MAG: hypothetical protein AAGG00_02365 [Cyanobacteria bacterium P01_H01_bin.150]